MGKSHTLIFKPSLVPVDFQWYAQWENVQTHFESYQIRLLIEGFLSGRHLHLNRFYLRQTHNNLHIQVESYNIFKNPRLIPLKFKHRIKKNIWVF